MDVSEDRKALHHRQARSIHERKLLSLSLRAGFHTHTHTLPTEGTTLEGKHEYCTTKMQTVLHDGGARSQSGSQSHTDFDLAPFTS